MKNIKSAFYSMLYLLSKPGYAFIFAFIIYFFFSMLSGSPFRISNNPYFSYLADAFLHRQLNLRIIPQTNYDLSFFEGNYYLYWPPMPAIILAPFVGVFGINFSDVFFTLVISSINIAILTKLLEEFNFQGIISLDKDHHAMLILFFTLGTVHVTLAPFGNVWYTAQLIGLLFILLSYLTTTKLHGARAFFLTGICIACAMLTRNHLVFLGIWPFFYLVNKHKSNNKILVLISAFLMPMLVLGTLFLFYNYLRFEDPFELGIRYHNMADVFIDDYNRYGAFNLHYLPTNFYYQYIYYPFPFSEKSLMGGSLFILSPVFFYAFRGLYLGIRNINVVLWGLAILLTSLPILFLMGTGWVQFGPRYTLDFTVPLLLITATGIQGTSKRLLLILVFISIIQYIPGVLIISQFR